MTDNKRLQTIKELVAIESIADKPRELHAALDYMATFVRKNNKSVTIERFEKNGKPSFLAYKGKQRPEKFHVIFNAHVDVVPAKPETFQMTIDGDKIYGRGVYDMKAACVVMAEIFCEYVDTLPFALGLQIVTDEEPGGVNGTLHQIEQGVRTDFAISGECGRSLSTYEIANETKGIVFANVVFGGKTAHGAYPWRGENAAMRAAHFVKALHEVYPTPTEEYHGTTATVTTIESKADVFNQLPERAIVKIDCRNIVTDPHFASQEDFVNFIKTLAPDATVTFDIFSAPMYADPDSSFMQSLKRAAEAVEEHDFTLVRRHASSDGRHYIPVGGQACEFGIAGEHQHAAGEYITYAALENFSTTLRTFLGYEANAIQSPSVVLRVDEKRQKHRLLLMNKVMASLTMWPK